MPTVRELPERFGRYRILRKLGAGGMGAVYLAEDTRLGRKVALKVPHFTADEDATVIDRFYREGRMAASIEHPNLCPVYDVGEIDGVHYLTMPYIEGTPLSRLVHGEQPWPPTQAAALMRQMALAVNALHQRGVIHRDLKPANVLLRSDGAPVLMDFGLARSFTAQSRRLTATGAAVGTPVYMSPEQIIGDPRAIGPGTDIYSLGVILYELVTGVIPFEGPLAAVYGQILHATPPPPSSYWPGLDSWVDAVCRRAMARRPEDRFATAGDFAAALEVHGRQPVPAATREDARPAPLPAETGGSRLSCPSCGKWLKIPRTNRARKIVCPACQTRVEPRTSFRETAVDVPPLREPWEPPALSSPLADPRIATSGRRGLLTAGIIGLVLLIAVSVGWLVFHASREERQGQGQAAAKNLGPDRPEAAKQHDPDKTANERPAKSADRKKPEKDTSTTKPPVDLKPDDGEVVRSILKEVRVPPINRGRDAGPPRFEEMPAFEARTLAAYPLDNTSTPLRDAVEHAQALLWALSPATPPPELADAVRKLKQSSEVKKVLNGLPEAYRAPVNVAAENALGKQLFEDSLRAASMVRILEDELDNLKKLGFTRNQVSRRWQANYDFLLARLKQQIAHVYEVASALGRMRKELPPRNPAVEGGWRLAAREQLQGDPTGKRLHKDARKLLDRIAVEHAGTPWEILARRAQLTPIGLEWMPEK